MRQVKVNWIDSHSLSGWTDEDGLKELIDVDARVSTRGFLLHEDSRCVIVSASVSNSGEYDSPILIPKVCIIKKKIIN